jgi:hypothetical protein
MIHRAPPVPQRDCRRRRAAAWMALRDPLRHFSIRR